MVPRYHLLLHHFLHPKQFLTFFVCKVRTRLIQNGLDNIVEHVLFAGESNQKFSHMIPVKLATQVYASQMKLFL